VKRFIVDWVGNYVFFVPIVLLFNAWQWPLSAVIVYMVSSIVLAAITGRLFTLFLKRVWYPLCRETF
jgi:hypothetical protein